MKQNQNNQQTDSYNNVVEVADTQQSAYNSDEVVMPAKVKRKVWDTHSLAVMGILTAISYILYVFVKFPLPFLFPAFLDIQISDMPALLGGFALGPVQGAVIIIVKCLLKMPFSSTACVGELGDIIIGIAFVVPASIIYHHNKCKKSAIVGLIIGGICAVLAALACNMWLLIPFYASAFGMDAIIGMVAGLYDGVTTDTFMNYYLPLAVVPFNILRTTICALIAYYTYKPLSRALHWEHKQAKEN